MHRLFQLELLKTKRSLLLWMMLSIPCCVVVLATLILVKRFELTAIGPGQWLSFRMASLGMWCSFMLPLYVAVVTGLLNGQEHRNQTWRLMLTLPVSQPALFAAKLGVAWMFVAGANLVLAAAMLASASALAAFGAPAGGVDVLAMMTTAMGTTLTCMPALAAQHAISWRVQNLSAPLAFALVMTMGIGQIGSSRYWVFDPWTYSMMYAIGSDPARGEQAFFLAIFTGAVIAVVTSLWLGRRVVRT